MIKTCPSCGYSGELTWRDGKYHCAMCDAEVSESQPEVVVREETVVQHATCPICRNRTDNLFNGVKYRCALCGTAFDLYQETWKPTSHEYTNQGNTSYSWAEEAKKQRKRHIILGVIFLFVFWPVSIYFFYKAHQDTKY